MRSSERSSEWALKTMASVPIRDRRRVRCRDTKSRPHKDGAEIGVGSPKPGYTKDFWQLPEARKEAWKPSPTESPGDPPLPQIGFDFCEMMKSSIKKLLMLKAPNFVVIFSAASGRQYSIPAEGVEAAMQRDGIVYMHISRTTNLRCRTVRSDVLRYHWLRNPQGWLGNWSGLLQGTKHSRERVQDV